MYNLCTTIREGIETMDKHRVRIAKSTDGSPLPHLFVEMEPDEWLEVQYRKITHAAIHLHLEWEAKSHKRQKSHITGHIRYDTRAFGTVIQNWEEGAPIQTVRAPSSQKGEDR